MEFFLSEKWAKQKYVKIIVSLMDISYLFDKEESKDTKIAKAYSG